MHAIEHTHHQSQKARKHIMITVEAFPAASHGTYYVKHMITVEAFPTAITSAAMAAVEVAAAASSGGGSLGTSTGTRSSSSGVG